jgi:phospholipase/carboxylesterase
MAKQTAIIGLEGPERAPRDGGKPRQMVVLLHGLGADGEDLMALADPFSEILPHAGFIAPDAPFRCDMGPMGYQWFSLQKSDPDSILKGVLGAAPILDSWLDRLLAEKGLSDKDLALVGFSQGCMMALYVGLRRKNKPAAILGYAGANIHGDDFAAEITARPRVMLVHGDADMVVSPLALDAAQLELAAAGVPVEAHKRRGVGHGIDPGGLQLGSEFLGRCFSPAN